MNKLFVTPTEWEKNQLNNKALSHSAFERHPTLYDLINSEDETILYNLKNEFYEYVANKKVIFAAFIAWLIPFVLAMSILISKGTATHNGILMNLDLRTNTLVLIYEIFFCFIGFIAFSVQVLLIGATIYALKFLATLDHRQDIQQLSKLHDMALDLKSDFSESDARILQDYTKFSYRLFRNNAKCVSNLAIKITILGIISFILFNIFLNQAVTASLEQGLIIVVIIAIAADILYLVALIFLFFYPQKAVNKWLINAKRSLIVILEELYQERLIEYFKISKQNIEKEERNLLVSEIEFLENQIEYTENLLTWPFDYRQLYALLITLIIPGITAISPFIKGL